MRCAVGIMVVAFVLVFVREASAQPAPQIPFTAELHVTLGPGTERCPEPSPFIRRAVVAEMAYDPFIPGAPWRRAGTFDVKVSRVPSGLEAVTTYVDAAGTTQWTRPYRVRSTVRAACESAYKGVALQIATELTRFADEPKPATTPAASCPACPTPAPCPPVSPFSVWPTEWPIAPLPAPKPDAPKPVDRWPVAVRLGVAAGPELIVSGLGSVGIAADIGVRYHAFSFGVEAHGDPPIGSLNYPGFGVVSFARVSAAVLACAHYGWFVGCGVGDVGRFLFPSHIHVLPASGFYGALGVRAGMEAPVLPPRLFIRTTLDLRAPIDPAIYTAAHGTLFAPASLGVGLGLGVLVEFGP